MSLAVSPRDWIFRFRASRPWLLIIAAWASEFKASVILSEV
jgi:hypothetical protein